MKEASYATAHMGLPCTIIEPRKGLFNIDLAGLWKSRELLYFLVWRDIKVRYKQTIIGAGWAVFQPLMTMLMFTAIFGMAAKIPSEGLPYPVFSFSALLLWSCFSQAVVRSSASLVGEAHLIKKIYFPRLVVPLSAVVCPVLDLCFSLPLLAGLLIVYGVIPGWQIVALPLFVMATVMIAVALGLWLSALNAQYRDIGYLIPFMVQLGMYASPIVYPVSLIPEQWLYLYNLNPMVGLIQGFRWTLFGGIPPSPDILAVNCATVLFVFLTGIAYFRRIEPILPDVI